MKFELRHLLILSTLVLGTLMSTNTYAQSACCAKGKDASAKAACCSSSSAKGKTAGCSPSSCRGAKTKFGEAKVISDLRLGLIALKADMEQSENVTFAEESFDIHGIVGDSDEESLAIIADQVAMIEGVFAEKLDYEPTQFDLPEQKAKQVQYLEQRIGELHKLLLIKV